MPSTQPSPVTALTFHVAILTTKGYDARWSTYDEEKLNHIASAWYIGSMTPPCSSHWFGTFTAKSST